jgi:hypothetical protein
MMWAPQRGRRNPSSDLVPRPPSPRGEGKTSLSGARAHEMTPSGPRQLVRTPVAAHLLPGEKGKRVSLRRPPAAHLGARARSRHPFLSPQGRGWLSPRAFTSGRERGAPRSARRGGEGLLPPLSIPNGPLVVGVRGDFRSCQTSTATPAQPGDLSTD